MLHRPIVSILTNKRALAISLCNIEDSLLAGTCHYLSLFDAVLFYVEKKKNWHVFLQRDGRGRCGQQYGSPSIQLIQMARIRPCGYTANTWAHFFKGCAAGRGVPYFILIDEIGFTWGMIRAAFPLNKRKCWVPASFFKRKRCREKTLSNYAFTFILWKLSSFLLVNGYQTCLSFRADQDMDKKDLEGRPEPWNGPCRACPNATCSVTWA